MFKVFHYLWKEGKEGGREGRREKALAMSVVVPIGNGQWKRERYARTVLISRLSRIKG